MRLRFSLVVVPLLFAAASHASPRQSNPAFLGIGFVNGPGGCTIETVTNGGPANEAHIEIGDTVLAFDAVPLDHAQPCDQLVANITTHSPGDKIRVDFERNTVHRNVFVTLSTRADVLQKRVGQRIGTTDLVDVDDERHHIDLGDNGKTRVVGWFTGACSGCARVFDRVADGLKDRAQSSRGSVALLAVTQRGNRDELKDFRKAFSSPVPLAVADNETFSALAMDEQDRAFFMVIDCKGVTRLVTPIAPDSDDLDGAVDEVLAGAEQAEHARARR